MTDRATHAELGFLRADWPESWGRAGLEALDKIERRVIARKQLDYPLG